MQTIIPRVLYAYTVFVIINGEELNKNTDWKKKLYLIEQTLILVYT